MLRLQHYFDVPKLESDIKEQLNAMMLEHPSLACAILDESSKMLAGEELATIAMERIRARPKASLLHWNGGAAVTASPRLHKPLGRHQSSRAQDPQETNDKGFFCGNHDSKFQGS